MRINTVKSNQSSKEAEQFIRSSSFKGINAVKYVQEEKWYWYRLVALSIKGEGKGKIANPQRRVAD